MSTFFTELPEEKEYTLSEKALRDFFIKQYLTDYDAFAAAIRCGFSPALAPQYSQKFMLEPYVLRQIKSIELEGNGKNETEERNALKQKVISGLVRESHYNGAGSSHAARVAAFSRLAQILGLDAEQKNQGISGGVMVVPEIANVDDWENIAAAQQEKLRNDAQLH